ncbi:GSCFA domain-containing protein [Salegentibacter sp. F14]
MKRFKRQNPTSNKLISGIIEIQEALWKKTMEFRTQIQIKGEQPKIDYDSKIMLLGSCFVENIGAKLAYYKIRTLQNPFGIFFHPQAIATFLERVDSGYQYSRKDIFFHNERWHCFEAHSSLSFPDKEGILDALNSKIQQTHAFLKEASHVVITLGSSWNYLLRDTGKAVANCHKFPQKNFRKELSPVVSVIENLERITGYIEKLNSKAEIILTISPIRHLRDGFIGNQRSKSNLIAAVHATEKGVYFPSYEIMMDDLRDYRFYGDDMLHLSSLAVDYIWKKFTETWFSKEAMITLTEVEKLQKGLAHRPFDPDSEGHKDFLKTLKRHKENLRKKHPHLKF